MTTPVRQFLIQPPAGYAPEIGLWIAALDDTRERTLQTVAGLTAEVLDVPGLVGTNTIGTLLYHIAGAEAMWLYSRILQQPPPAAITALFAHEPHDEQGLLTQLHGEGLEPYLLRLSTVRDHTRAACQAMSVADFRHVWTHSGARGRLEVSMEGAVQQLMQHEAEHRGHIQLILESQV